MKAMILAAGRGERMRPLTDCCPKPLLQIAGKSLIDYHIEGLVAAGVREIVVNAAWLADHLADHLGNGARFGARIVLLREHEALETAGGIINALPALGQEPFILVNGDVWADYDFHSLLSRVGELDLAHLVLVPNPPHNEAGDFSRDQRGLLALDGSPRYTYAGIALLSPRLFAGLPSGRAPLAPLLRQGIGRISAEIFCGQWCDVGTPERLAWLEREYTRSTPVLASGPAT